MAIDVRATVVRIAVAALAVVGCMLLGYSVQELSKNREQTQPTVVEHKIRYYIMEAEHGVSCIYADSTWKPNFVVFCTPAIEDAVDLMQRLAIIDKGGTPPVKKEPK